MQKNDLIYIGHMLDFAREALDSVENKDRFDYDTNRLLRRTLTYLILVIGEAASQLSRDFCDRHPQIPWKAIIGMRHKIAHDYLSVDEDIVWKTVIEELPVLIKELDRIEAGKKNSNNNLKK
ncbi:DUF86 domain-containing protein [bacterium]|nr:DUF86 domain-containing protein [bacterium]